LEDSALALGVSPDGSTVFVTGDSCKDYPCGDSDYATVAYGALAGNQLWASRYDGPADVNSLDDTSAIGVTPDGSTVIVTGSSIGSTNDYDYATVAYAAAGGGQLWVRRYDGPASGDDNAHGLGVSPDGLRAFVTGASGGGGSGYSYLDYATIAYDVYTGAQVWVKRYDGAGHGEDQATALGVSASGPTVLVTGYSDTGFGTDLYDYATVAYDASTGTKLWAKRYNGPGNGADQAHALAMASGGSTVFVTGTSLGSSSGFDYATVAYSVI